MIKCWSTATMIHCETLLCWTPLFLSRMHKERRRSLPGTSAFLLRHVRSEDSFKGTDQVRQTNHVTKVCKKKSKITCIFKLLIVGPSCEQGPSDKGVGLPLILNFVYIHVSAHSFSHCSLSDCLSVYLSVCLCVCVCMHVHRICICMDFIHKTIGFQSQSFGGAHTFLFCVEACITFWNFYCRPTRSSTKVVL